LSPSLGARKFGFIEKATFAIAFLVTNFILFFTRVFGSVGINNLKTLHKSWENCKERKLRWSIQDFAKVCSCEALSLNFDQFSR
jgi:hypothetical protein